MKILFHIPFLFAILLAGCIDTIDFTGEGNAAPLVIYGNLKTGELPSALTIRQTQPTGGPGANINDAAVLLTNGAGDTAAMLPDGEGVYRFEPTAEFPLTAGESYALEVRLSDGRVFTADPQMMPAAPPPAEGTARVRPGTADVSLRADFTGTTEAQYLRVTFDEVYSFPEITCNPFIAPKTCYFERELPMLFMPLADNGEGSITDTVTAEVFSLSDLSDLQGGFWGKHYYNLYVHSIPKEAHEYWQQINQISNAQGTIFDAPPAVVKGNIYEKDNPENRALGYFETSQVSVTRPFITLLTFLEAGIQVAPYCPVGVLPSDLQFGNFDRACCNCTRLEGASLDKPDWF